MAARTEKHSQMPRGGCSAKRNGNKDLDTYNIYAYTAAMDTNTLAVFVEVVRKRSFTAVARERDVDPATIARTVAGLERELGLRLFQRTTRVVQPTEAGMVYF